MRAIRGALALGAGLLISAWALGSGAMAVAGLGVSLAGLSGLGWALLAERLPTLERVVPAGVLTEGDDLRYAARLRGASPLPGRFVLRDRLGPAGELELQLRRRSATLAEHRSAPRGRYAIGPGRLVAVDPLGLARVEREIAASEAVVVVPRVPAVDTLFLDTGRFGIDGGRSLARRGGSEPHGVRDYEEGEPLRAIHWASSARRARLMVRELEDSPHDVAVVVLDLDARGLAGPAGRSSLDEAVRAAGAIVRAHAARGLRAALVLAGDEPRRITVSSTVRDWESALLALAAADAAHGSCTESLLRAGDRSLRERSFTLVTAREVLPFVEPLLARRGASLVAVDARTYAGAPPSPPDPSLLRLAAHGVPVAVVRAGDDLARVLSGRRQAVAHG